MIILLSPAKTLDFTSSVADEPTTPRFEREAGSIARAAAKLSPDDLAGLMHNSEKLAELNAGRFKTFRKAESRPAIRAFSTLR